MEQVAETITEQRARRAKERERYLARLKEMDEERERSIDGFECQLQMERRMSSYL